MLPPAPQAQSKSFKPQDIKQLCLQSNESAWEKAVSAIWPKGKGDNHYFGGIRIGAPLSFTKNTKNFADSVLLAFLPTT